LSLRPKRGSLVDGSDTVQAAASSRRIARRQDKLEKLCQ
jgi:hypothetical protein